MNTLVKEREKVLKTGEQLAKYILDTSFHDLPKEVIHQVKRLILDSVGTIYMGTRKEEASGIKRFLMKLGVTQDCTIIGADLKTNCQWAAFSNASYAQVHDCNDGHLEAAALGGSAHPGRVVIPTALAVGEKLSSSGKEVLSAIAIGYDVAVRVRGMSERPPSSAYCAAAIASRLMGLDIDKLRFALGIAGYHSPRNFPTAQADTNFLSNGYLVKVGIEAAFLADEGFFGPPLGDDRRLSTRFTERGLGKEFEILNTYIKPYPTCRMTHGAIEAILDIKKNTDLKHSDIEEVTINQLTHGMYIAESKVDTDSYYKTCQFNLPYISACAIIDGEITEKQFTKERIADPIVHELAKKIKINPDEDLDAVYPETFRRPTIVEIKTKNGKKHTKHIEYPKGSSKNPLTDDELFEKFIRWAGPSITKEKALKIKKSIFELEKLTNVNTFTNLLSA